MRKTFTSLFAGTAALALSACQASEPAEEVATPDPEPAEAVAVEAPTETTDGAEGDLEGTGNPIGPGVTDEE